MYKIVDFMMEELEEHDKQYQKVIFNNIDELIE